MKTITFGNYWQSNNYDKEPIEWYVLKKEENNALIISRNVLDSQIYDTDYESYTTWETSSLREWLNDTFINNAFSTDEQKMILNSFVSADKNPSYDTPSGNNTNDKAFLLSIIEAKELFNSDEARLCQATLYAKEHGALSLNRTDDENCFWWLRTPGYGSDGAAIVRTDGSIYNYGVTIHCGLGVRPALWISLNKASD